MKRLIMIGSVMLCLMLITFADGESFAAQGKYRVFYVDGCYGDQTLDGETVVPAQYAGILPFHGDLCIVESESCYGLWRLSTGEELLSCCYASLQIAGSMVLVSDPYISNADVYLMTQLYDPENDRAIINVRDTVYGE